MLSKDDVLAVARLSRLELTDSQVDKFQNQLSGVIKLFDEIKTVNTDQVLETSQVTGLKNIAREDKVFYDENLRPSDTGKLLKNVPCCEGNNIIVPKVIEAK